jgi:hypothetical protein
VIDPGSGTIYVAALINDTGYLLFALDTSTGHQISNSSISAPGFQYLPEEQRGALALANGFVYVPFGGYSWSCFYPGPIGWVIAMSPTGSGEEYAWHPPTMVEGDVWEPEGVSVGASGTVYLVTGDSDNASFDYGNAVIALSPDLTFAGTQNDYFAASNWQYTNQNDMDLSDTGATLLPDNLLFSIGKDGIGYLLNATDLGGIGGQLASLQICSGGAWGSTTYANGVIYVPCGEGLKAVEVHSGAQPTLTSLWNNTFGFAGPAIVAGGAVLTVDIYSGVLYALNPMTGAMIGMDMVVPTDTFAHFTTPSVGDGLLFLAGNDTIFGLSPSISPTAASALPRHPIQSEPPAIDALRDAAPRFLTSLSARDRFLLFLSSNAILVAEASTRS